MTHASADTKDSPHNHDAHPLFRADLHCHVFNATDLPIRGFLKGWLRGVGTPGPLLWLIDPALRLLQRQLWAAAPTAESEADTLDIVVSGAAPRPSLEPFFAVPTPWQLLGAATTSIRADDRRRDIRGLKLLSVTTPASEAPIEWDESWHPTPPSADWDKGPALPEEERVLEWLRASAIIDPDVALFVGVAPTALKSLDATKIDVAALRKGLLTIWGFLKGAAPFLGALARSRRDNLRALAREDRVSLFVPALIDFNGWIDGDDAPSTMRQQVELFSLLSQRCWSNRLGLGRRVALHGYVGFNPIHAGNDALQTVKDAVLHHGFVGVKLYLACGFTPDGNANRREVEHDQPLAVRRRIDRALHSLYAFCESAGVPLLVHTGKFNSFAKSFGRFSHPTGWLGVLERYPKLRICLAHGGLNEEDLTVKDDGSTRYWIHDVVALAKACPEQVFFDISNTDRLDPGEAARVVEALGPSDGLMRRRLFYGSDFFMCELNVEGAHGYEGRVAAQVCTELGGGDLCADFFGNNALNFLGLAPGENTPNRERLMTWYDAHCPSAPRPDWLPVRGP